MQKRAGRGVVLLAVGGLALGAGAVRAPGHDVRALVVGDRAALRAAVARHGGTVAVELTVVDGAVVTVPSSEVDALAHEPGVTSVAVDRAVTFESVLPGTTYDPVTQAGSMLNTAALTGAKAYWDAGWKGTGVDVALVDTGVQPSAYLGTRLLAGTDVSGENNALSDGFGHGTHMAGIIAGSVGEDGEDKSFAGMAPRARVVSVKVADKLGASGLVKLLQGLDWVFMNRVTGGRNIKVVNLSLGVPEMSSYVNDPLASAVERLWMSGVSVVASVGNIGPGAGLLAPAYDPYTVAVGALDTKGTVSATDDAVASFSAGSVNAADRRPDILAPGRSVQSLLASGSVAASLAPATSKIGAAFVIGSGTSQATAVVSGALALMYQEQPMAMPSSQKLRMTNHSTPMSGDARVLGAGKLNLQQVLHTTDLGIEVYPFASASTTNVSATTDNAARIAGPQGSLWLGSQWLGSQWLGSVWLGSTWK